MKISIVIDRQTPRRAIKALVSRPLVGIGVVVLLLLTAGAVAGISQTPTHTFVPNTVISSAQMNKNFGDLMQIVFGLRADFDSGGLKGDKGDKGDTGPDGLRGDQGDPGDPGAQGKRGPDGDAGQKGPAGPQGKIGPEGLKTLIKTDQSAAYCGGKGGIRIEIGLDTANFGVLDSNEITQTKYVCSGKDGTVGQVGDKGPKGTDAQLGPRGYYAFTTYSFLGASSSGYWVECSGNCTRTATICVLVKMVMTAGGGTCEISKIGNSWTLTQTKSTVHATAAVACTMRCYTFD